MTHTRLLLVYVAAALLILAGAAGVVACAFLTDVRLGWALVSAGALAGGWRLAQTQPPDPNAPNLAGDRW